MYSAIADEPTKLTAEMPGWWRMASTAALSPLTTLKTPSGNPASFSSAAIRMPAEGSRSDGLRMKQLPQASATGNIHIGTMTGKLNGVIPATTPRGWRSDQLSMPRPTCSVYSPFNSWGMPQANSTTSMPRVTSPLASDSTLPCSSVTMRANSSACLSSSSRKRKSTRALVSGGVAAQSGKAPVAALTAASTSPASARATRLARSPVAGLKTSPKRPLVPATILPARKGAGELRRPSSTARLFELAGAHHLRIDPHQRVGAGDHHRVGTVRLLRAHHLRHRADIRHLGRGQMAGIEFENAVALPLG